MRRNPRTVILCTHRSSLQCLRELLPPEVHIVEAIHVGLDDLPGVPASLKKGAAALMGETALGLSDLAVVECPKRNLTAENAERGEKTRGMIGRRQESALLMAPR